MEGFYKALRVTLTSATAPLSLVLPNPYQIFLPFPSKPWYLKSFLPIFYKNTIFYNLATLSGGFVTFWLCLILLWQESILHSRNIFFNNVYSNCLDFLPPCYSHSPILTNFTAFPPLSKSCLKLVCNVNTVYGNLKSENSQETSRNWTFMNSTLGLN
jgi:hypothetical protein